MSSEEPRWAEGEGPVSPRRRRPLLVRNEPVEAPPELLRRRERIAQRHEGVQGLLSLQDEPRPAPVPAGAVVLGLAGVALGSGALLALEGTGRAAAIGLAMLLAGACAAWLLRVRRAGPTQIAAPRLSDEQLGWLQALDALLARTRPELDDGLRASLQHCHDALLRALPLAGDLELPDRYYLDEATRRYLPDSLQAFLALPPAHRDAAACESLRAQLSLLREAIEQRERKAVSHRAEALERQREFLRRQT
jgi:hypothetical protein